MSIVFEPLIAEPRPDPYPVYRRLRDEAPAHFAPRSDAWCISRHQDVSYVLSHPELFSSRANQTVLMNADLGPLSLRGVRALLGFLWKARITPGRLQRAVSLIASDPPRHEAMRGILKRGFTPRMIASLEPGIRKLVGELMAAPRDGSAFDVIDDLAIPLPTTIIAEMLGVEPERRADFKRWSDAVIAVSSGAARENPIDSGLIDSFGELFAYIRATIRSRRRSPGEDLISVLADSSHGVSLDEVDLVQFVVLLLVAGNETTTNLIGNAASALLDHPEELERVAQSPSLVPALVEEALRFDSPVQMIIRNTTREVEIAGTRLPAGTVVVPLLGAANRDERRFQAPDAFRICRETKGHVAFGFGIHFCMGAALARLEARVALEALVPELARRARADQTVEWIDSFLVRGRRHLMLEPA